MMPKPNTTLPFEFAKDFDREDEIRIAAEKELSRKQGEEAHRAMEKITRKLRQVMPIWQAAQRKRKKTKGPTRR
jgi:hypothetical protein